MVSCQLYKDFRVHKQCSKEKILSWKKFPVAETFPLYFFVLICPEFIYSIGILDTFYKGNFCVRRKLEKVIVFRCTVNVTQNSSTFINKVIVVYPSGASPN